MSRWTRSFAGIAIVAGLGLAAAGCSNPASPPKADKMGGEKMGDDKMGGDKMGGDKMGGDKMGDKMKEKPGG